MVITIATIAAVGTTSTTGIIALLTRLAKVVYRRTDEDVLGMKLRTFVALSYLSEHRMVPQQDLAEAFHMDANNLVLLLNDLETSDLAERHRDPNDRRRHFVQITPAGARAVKRAEQAREAIEDEVLGGLDADERETLRRLLIKALEG
jgi:DNA-binding MarR family transcriptional regulator